MRVPRLSGTLPSAFSPTRVRFVPPASSALMTSDPGYPPALRALPMVQASLASTGLVVSSKSFPYRHMPDSSLSVSRAPRPAGSTSSMASKPDAKPSASSPGRMTSKPSSPV